MIYCECDTLLSNVDFKSIFSAFLVFGQFSLSFWPWRTGYFLVLKTDETLVHSPAIDALLLKIFDLNRSRKIIIAFSCIRKYKV